jgi:F0F1-type ATP synthase assembly protein I
MSDIQRKSTPPKASWWYISLVSQIGLVIAMPMVVCAFIGRWLDKQLATAPWMTLVLLVVGTMISIFNFASVIRKITMR